MQIRNFCHKLICGSTREQGRIIIHSGSEKTAINTGFSSPPLPSSHSHDFSRVCPPAPETRPDSSARSGESAQIFTILAWRKLIPGDEMTTRGRDEGGGGANGQINMQVHFPLEPQGARGALIWESVPLSRNQTQPPKALLCNSLSRISGMAPPLIPSPRRHQTLSSSCRGRCLFAARDTN